MANMGQVPDRVTSSNVKQELIIEGTADRETSSKVKEELIIGRTVEKRKILSILSESDTQDMVILPIYGIGGIGKTTLAKLVYNDKQFQGYSRVWIYVSEKLDFYKIGNSIITQISKKESHIAKPNMEILHTRLEKQLDRKRILIVLDDLWEDKPRVLDELKDMLRLGKGKKVIIVTTRDAAIAKNICGTMKNEPYKLEILTDDMSWAIIKQKCDFEKRSDKKQLEPIGIDIAKKCGGVALAAQALGYLLKSKRTNQWESVRNSNIWESSLEETDEVLASLRLTYSHMNIWLQSCFSYCAVFPRGHNIVMYDLIHEWIALDFTQPSRVFDSMQQCEQYVEQLLGMSFLQYTKTPSSDGRHDEDVTVFTMHDLVHDLATAMLAGKVNKNGNDVGSSCQYALLTDPSKPLQSSVGSPENIKALHFLHGGNVELRDGAISPATGLLVLDLSGCIIQKLPDSIGQLKQLRYLHAPGIRDQTKILDCISQLSRLNYLNLSGSRYILELPESIGNMKDLLHLDLSGCEGIRALPVTFGELKQLVHLDLSHCRLSVSESLGGFTMLQYLNISPSFGKAAKYIERLPEVIGNLRKLRYLNLSKCMLVMAPSEDEAQSLLTSISTLSNLEHLDLSYNMNFHSIPDNIENLTKLHTLDVTNCSIQERPEWMDRMVSLKIVTGRFNKSSSTTKNFASLPQFKVHASPSEGRSNLILLEPTDPDRLELSGLENVMSAEEAQSIKLLEKGRMTYLILEWTMHCETRFADDKDVLEKLVPPNTIGILAIMGYRSLTFPNWLMGMGQYLPNVSTIFLEHCPNLDTLPPLGRLPNLKKLYLRVLDNLEDWNTGDSCGELMFPKLNCLLTRSCAKLRIEPCLPCAESLSIEGSDNVLTQWGESVPRTSASASSVVTELVVQDCKVPLYEWRLLQHISALRSLTIDKCSDLTRCTPEIMGCLSSLESLSLTDHVLVELPTWLSELTVLQRLSISLPKLEKLNDSLKQLTRLESLSLQHCTSMNSLEWLGELTSLKELSIYGDRIKYVPGSIRQLTKLQVLEINGSRMEIPRMREMFFSKSAVTKGVDVDQMSEYLQDYRKEGTMSYREGLNHSRDTVRFVVNASPSEHNNNLILLEPKNPDTLEISRLENMMSVEEAQSIKLREKYRVKKLTLEWTVYHGTRFADDKDVLEKLEPPETIERLYLCGYNGPSLPNWLESTRLYLPNLCRISLSYFRKCNNLSPLGQLPNLEWLGLLGLDSLEEWTTTYCSGANDAEAGRYPSFRKKHCSRANALMFRKLKRLEIRYCAKLRIMPCLPRAVSFHIQACDNMLTSWGESVSQTSSSYSSLVTDLEVEDCRVPLYQWRFIQDISALRNLTIYHCSDLTRCTPEIIRCFSSLESLSLKDDVLAELPTWLFVLTSLQRLIIDFPNLEKLDDGLRKLTRLESLTLWQCRSMTSLPQWLGQLTSLTELNMSNCQGIRSFPDSIQQMTNLQRLYIYECATLVKWCESDENKMKLAHIRDKTFPEALTNSLEDTASGSRITRNGTAAATDMEGHVRSLSVLSIDSGSATTGMSGYAGSMPWASSTSHPSQLPLPRPWARLQRNVVLRWLRLRRLLSQCCVPPPRDLSPSKTADSSTTPHVLPLRCPPEAERAHAAAKLLADLDALTAIEESVEDEPVEARNRHKMIIADDKGKQIFTELKSEDSNDDDMPWFLSAANDHEAGGSSKAPLIELSSDEE